MATPTDVHCAIPAGRGVKAGTFIGGMLSGLLRADDALAAGAAMSTTLPTWVAAAVPGRWGVVPAVSTLSALDPKFNPAMNPAYPESPEWYGNSGFGGIITPWCGAVMDTLRSRLCLGPEGGHQDYGGNEPYEFLLDQEVPEWRMLRPPSGAVGNILTTKDGQEASGVYADGQPRSPHTYNKHVFVPTRGTRYLCTLGNAWFSGQNGKTCAVELDHTTGLYALKATQSDSSVDAACFDPTLGDQGSIWARGAGSNFKRFQRYDVAANTWTQNIGPTAAYNDYLGLAYMQGFKCLFMAHGAGFSVFDTVAEAYYNPPSTGSAAGAFGSSQPHWINGRAYFWNNSANLTHITRLTPPANPRTGSWVIDALPLDGGNSVTPTARQSNGTFGRFAYAPLLGIFVLLNAVNQPVYFFKPLEPL